MGKVALITGGRSGIGLACAQKLSETGYDVVTAQRSPAANFYSIEADLSDPETPQKVIQQVIDRHDRLDALINNAGIMLEDTVEEMSLQDWNRTLHINLTAPFLLIKHATPHLKGNGAIVNVGSIEGLGSNPQHAAYCASKAGLHALTRAVAVDAGPQGIRCNAIAPGFIETDMTAAIEDKAREELIGAIPLKRIGAATEIAAAVEFLVGPAGGYITGQTLVIDGGLSL
mgnify:CR=1 FL=1